MWKLIIERKHNLKFYERESELVETVICEAENLGELVLIVEAFKPHAINGEYKYKIENVEKGEPKDA